MSLVFVFVDLFHTSALYFGWIGNLSPGFLAVAVLHQQMANILQPHKQAPHMSMPVRPHLASRQRESGESFSVPFRRSLKMTESHVRASALQWKVRKYVEHFSRGKKSRKSKHRLKSLYKKGWSSLPWQSKGEHLAPLTLTEANPRPGSMMEHETTVSPGGEKTIMQCFHQRPDSGWLVNTQEALVRVFTEAEMSTRVCVRGLPSKTSALHSNQNSKHPELQESTALLRLMTQTHWAAHILHSCLLFFKKWYDDVLLGFYYTL